MSLQAALALEITVASRFDKKFITRPKSTSASAVLPPADSRRLDVPRPMRPPFLVGIRSQVGPSPPPARLDRGPKVSPKIVANPAPFPIRAASSRGKCLAAAAAQKRCRARCCQPAPQHCPLLLAESARENFLRAGWARRPHCLSRGVKKSIIRSTSSAPKLEADRRKKRNVRHNPFPRGLPAQYLRLPDQTSLRNLGQDAVLNW